MPESEKRIYVWLDNDSYHAFVKYRGALGLTENTALVRLLITRELRLRRLVQPWNKTALHGPNKKIAFLPTGGDARVRSHAPDLELNEILRRLVLLELEEKWLERALNWVPDK
jgi:hypothetical protein